MRTIVTLEPDVAAAVTRLRQDRHLSVSQAVNQLARAGLAARDRRQPFVQRIFDMGPAIDLTCVAEAIDQLDGTSH